ncbi:MAG: FAD-dependent oxidoreductase [Deltaproteobacteria bacterium]|nr:FAD-dependent oxidoreductase [Deltaproteobacteria bacterium]
MSRKKVAIFGGGIAGLSAAQELARRFEVHVFEASDEVGGKARSQQVVGTGVGGRRDLPGEHGFRFFPAFYQNVIRTMDEIPVSGGGSVKGRLVPCDEFAIAQPEDQIVRVPRGSPKDVGDYFQIADALADFLGAFKPSERELAKISMKMLRFMVSCDERRLSDFESISFWDFIEGNSYSPKFQRILQSPRFMVAMQGQRGSARTVGRMALQILLDFRRANSEKDRLLDGPTKERWLDPWRVHLDALGVKFHLSSALKRLQVDESAKRVVGAELADGTQVNADYFLIAVPIEKVQPLISDELARVDDALRVLRTAPVTTGASPLTAWMTGAQFFLRRRVDVCRGHVAYAASTWALSSVSQGQFWGPESAPLKSHFGAGDVEDVISVDVSDWFTKNAEGKMGIDMTSEDEVLDEVWKQLSTALNGGGQVVISDADVVHRRLDSNVRFEPGPSGAVRPVNTTPLLVHPPGSLEYRPRAFTEFSNLMLASDYVQTSMDLATMEGANEAARRAAYAIHDNEGGANPVRVMELVEDTGPLVAAAKALDKQRWADQTQPDLLELADMMDGVRDRERSFFDRFR